MFENQGPMFDWVFRARLLRVVDGDTYWLRVDLGFRTSGEHPIRLWGLDTPELRTPEGKEARQFVIDWFDQHQHGYDWPVVVETDKTKQTFNRYVGKVWCQGGHSLGEALKDGGYEK